MKVAKWGNSLAVRLPAAVVDALQLKDGDDVEIQVGADGSLGVSRKPDIEELSRRVRKLRGLIPKDFKFNREELYERKR